MFFNSAGLIERMISDFAFRSSVTHLSYVALDAMRSAPSPVTSGFDFSPDTYPHVSFFMSRASA